MFHLPLTSRKNAPFKEARNVSRIAFSSLALGILTLGAASAQAAVVDDFESYTPNTSLTDNGWTRFGNATSNVYPSGTLPASSFSPLEGSQSVYVGGASTYVLFSRGWGSASSEVKDGATLSWLVKQGSPSATTGRTTVYLSHNVAGSTPAGVFLDHASNEFVLYGGDETDTNIAYTAGNTYLIEMVLNFTTDSFDAYATDVTASGPRTALGTKGFGTDLSAATVAASGGVFLGNTGGSDAFWDDIQLTGPIPEPASLALLGLGGTLLLSRRRQDA